MFKIQNKSYKSFAAAVFVLVISHSCLAPFIFYDLEKTLNGLARTGALMRTLI